MQPAVWREDEMLSPCMPPRVKQSNEPLALRIHRRDVWALLPVTANAAQAEVIQVIGTLVLPSDDVVDLVSHHRDILRERAVLARTPGAALDRVAKLLGKSHDAARTVRSASAWSLSKLSMSFSRMISSYS